MLSARLLSALRRRKIATKSITSASENGDDPFIEYGSGSKKITFQDIPGVKEGTSPAQAGIGKAGDGGLVADQ